MQLPWTPAVKEALGRARVGIAGAGGLGSHAALALARAHIGTLVLADFDAVEASNLLRQQYSTFQVGMAKIDALRENILAARPTCHVEVHNARVTPDNFLSIFGAVDVLIEAFDRADQKQMLVETAGRLRPDLWVVMGSGVAGFGDNNALRTEVIGRLVIVGDGVSAVADDNRCIAPRVGAVGHLQANAVLEILLSDVVAQDAAAETGADGGEADGEKVGGADE